MKILILRDIEKGPKKGAVVMARSIPLLFGGGFQIIERGPYLGVLVPGMSACGAIEEDDLPFIDLHIQLAEKDAEIQRLQDLLAVGAEAAQAAIDQMDKTSAFLRELKKESSAIGDAEQPIAQQKRE
ncbi:hypothetical protein [Paenibacillus daejeonensis]|uniref:hypothetical protein n=1 Tax=Paenibacillus daejeonensis TaxID=135193 RepID=UPI0003631E62|nr:hypothetical protein [Paenibacillus daejeonensis]